MVKLIPSFRTTNKVSITTSQNFFQPTFLLIACLMLYTNMTIGLQLYFYYYMLLIPGKFLLAYHIMCKIMGLAIPNQLNKALEEECRSLAKYIMCQLQLNHMINGCSDIKQKEYTQRQHNRYITVTPTQFQHILMLDMILLSSKQHLPLILSFFS